MRFAVCVSLMICAALVLTGCGTSTHPSDRLLKHADVLLSQGKTTQAIDQIDSAIAQAPRRYLTYAQALEVLYSHVQWADAARVGDKLLGKIATSDLDRKLSDDEAAESYAIVAQAHWMAGHKLLAEDVLKRALKRYPDYPSILNNLGYFYAERGANLKEALTYTRRAVELVPGQAAFVDSLGWVQYKSGDYKSAVETLKDAVALDPNNAEIRYHLGVAYAELGKMWAAKIELRKALSIDPFMTKAAERLHTKVK